MEHLCPNVSHLGSISHLHLSLGTASLFCERSASPQQGRFLGVWRVNRGSFFISQQVFRLSLHLVGQTESCARQYQEILFQILSGHFLFNSSD